MLGMGRIMGLLKVYYSFLVQRASYIKYDGSRIFLHTLETLFLCSLFKFLMCTVCSILHQILRKTK